MGLTERLYYTDSYLTTFHARPVRVEDQGRWVYLDRTAFYPTSGGQPHDTGTIAGARVLDVIDEGDEIAHVLSHSLVDRDLLGEGDAVRCSVDWDRRYEHMQQH